MRAELYCLRTRDGDEIDFLVIGPNGRCLLLEAKLAVQATSSIQVPKEFAKILVVRVRVRQTWPLKMLFYQWRVAAFWLRGLEIH